MGEAMTAIEGTVEIAKVIGPVLSTVLVPYMAWRLRQIEKNTNSKMDTVIELTRSVAKTEGKAEGEQQEKAAQQMRDQAKD